MGLVKRTYVDGETVITADNLNDIQDEIIQNASDISTKGTYSKPTGGIPKTDLASSVQDSLDDADTAYQKPQAGIPDTDLASSVQTSLGKADTAYQKPAGGILSTDLASAVQTSLEKADTALQSSDIDNTLSVTGKAADAKKTGDEISDVRNTLYTIGGQFKGWVNNAELNSYTQTGTFSVGTGATVGGSAFGFTYFLLTVVAPRTDTLNQIVEYGNLTYTREYRNGSWSSFEKVITTKDVGEFAVYSFNNAQTCVFELSVAPSKDTYGTFILFNANQNTMGLVKLETAPTVASLYGTITYAISLSGKTVTITPSARLWGKTVIAGVYG